MVDFLKLIIQLELQWQHRSKSFSSYNLLDKLITHVKDEGGNLSTLAQTFDFMVKCVPLVLVTP
jgi:hypothetical protein